MTAIVSIEQYDEEEAAAKCDVSYVEMMAFATTTFAIFGFPAIVAREQELARYVDWNNSPSNEQYFRPDYFVRGPSVETSFTPRERQIVETVSELGGGADGAVLRTRDAADLHVALAVRPIPRHHGVAGAGRPSDHGV